MIRYLTIENEAQAEQVIERSRFIAHIRPVESKEEADLFFSDIRKQYKDATHNVPAFVIGDKSELQWASDDGEPQGTSGAPIVQMLVNEGLTNLAVIVTRYFGGIKLGTGGLVRAYTSSAKLAIDAAGIVEIRDAVSLKISVEYPYFQKLEQLSKQGFFEVEEPEFSDKVSLQIITTPEDEAKVLKLIENNTSGTVSVLEKCVDKRAFSVVR